jgi:hypothetical protein
MPRYSFNIVVRGRKAIPDPAGDELAGDKEARKHAKMVAREMPRIAFGISAALSIGV